MLSRVDSRELTEWMAYARIEPFGERRADIRSAIGFAALLQAWGGKCSVSDLMPDFSRIGEPVQSQEEQELMLLKLTLMHGGEIRDGNNRNNRP